MSGIACADTFYLPLAILGLVAAMGIKNVKIEKTKVKKSDVDAETDIEKGGDDEHTLQHGSGDDDIKKDANMEKGFAGEGPTSAYEMEAMATVEI